VVVISLVSCANIELDHFLDQFRVFGWSFLSKSNHQFESSSPFSILIGMVDRFLSFSDLCLTRIDVHIPHWQLIQDAKHALVAFSPWHIFSDMEIQGFSTSDMRTIISIAVETDCFTLFP
jgi:hypothetical protein